MNQCKNCDKDITDRPRNKFCSHSCASKFNNKGVRRHGIDRSSVCGQCGNFTKNVRFCSHKCQAENRIQKVFEKIKSGKYNSTWSGNTTLRKFLIGDRGYKCECCGLSEWIGKPIPLSVHHKDGDAANNTPNNIELLCLNCHGLTPNFGRKNSQGSRTYRYK